MLKSRKEDVKKAGGRMIKSRKEDVKKWLKGINF